MKRLAFLLASDQYVYCSPTPFCHNDAQLLHNTLLSECDYAEQDIHVELLSPENSKSPYELLQTIEKLAQNSEPGDTLLFFYAGHGHIHNNEPYLILPTTELNNIEKTALPIRDLNTRLRNPERINIRIFDACHSGYDARQTGFQAIDTSGFTRSIQQEQNEGWITFAACHAEERSYPDDTLQNGIFTHSFCEAIKEFANGESILPELLKLKVCNRVEQWCKQNNKIQRPTFNCSISGNVDLAKRVVRKTNPITAIDSSATQDQNILDRLDNLRGRESFSLNNRKQLLTSYIKQVHESLHSNQVLLKNFGCEINIIQTTNAARIPNEFKPVIINFIENRNLQPIHTIEIQERYEENGHRLSMLFDRKIVRTNIIQQSEHWPNSYTHIEVLSDGYAPGGLLFFYLIPLQIRACLLWGIGTCSNLPGGKHIFEEGTLNAVFLDFEESKDGDLLEIAVNKGYETLRQQLMKRLSKRLDYIESELIQS